MSPPSIPFFVAILNLDRQSRSANICVYPDAAFAANVLLATEAIIADPDRFALTVNGLRYVRVHRFPYVVLFSISDAELLILGALHTARSIEKWRKKRG